MYMYVYKQHAMGIWRNIYVTWCKILVKGVCVGKSVPVLPDQQFCVEPCVEACLCFMCSGDLLFILPRERPKCGLYCR